MTITFNPSELGMVYMGMDIYRINADERLEDEIIVLGHLSPFKLVSDDRYVNEEGVKLYIK